MDPSICCIASISPWLVQLPVFRLVKPSFSSATAPATSATNPLSLFPSRWASSPSESWLVPSSSGTNWCHRFVTDYSSRPAPKAVPLLAISSNCSNQSLACWYFSVIVIAWSKLLVRFPATNCHIALYHDLLQELPESCCWMCSTDSCPLTGDSHLWICLLGLGRRRIG